MVFVVCCLVAIAFVQALQGVAILGLLRQVGLLSLRIRPAGAKTLQSGPKQGDRVPDLELPDLLNGESRLYVPPVDGRPLILTFVTAGCSSCQLVAPAIKALAADNSADVNWAIICLDRPSECLAFQENNGLRDVIISRGSDQIRDLYEIGTTPYSLLIDQEGNMVAKGLVNHIEHLESLVNVAKELSYQRSSANSALPVLQTEEMGS